MRQQHPEILAKRIDVLSPRMIPNHFSAVSGGDERIHHVTEGAPTSDVNTNGDDGSWSRLSRRSARSSTPLNG